MESLDFCGVSSNKALALSAFPGAAVLIGLGMGGFDDTEAATTEENPVIDRAVPTPVERILGLAAVSALFRSVSHSAGYLV
jgi:hypothetical protein